MHDAYRECRLCPRDCGVDRTAGRRGRCGETAALRVASIGPHFGEEPCFSGTRGSGTVFFSGCSSGCFFCQNWQISAEHAGETLDGPEFERRVRALLERGVHNLNLVTPDHFWPHAAALVDALRADGLRVPVLFNGSGYTRPEMVPVYAERIDLFLPDFKFAEPALAEEVMGDAAYPRLALESLRRMVEAKGFAEPWDPSGAGVAERGVLVRHLVLPGRVENSLAVLRLLRAEFGAYLPLSVMSQYRPVPACAGRGAFERRVTRGEYARVCDAVGELGFHNVFAQAPDPGDGFLPDFRRAEPFRGNRAVRAPEAGRDG